MFKSTNTILAPNPINGTFAKDPQKAKNVVNAKVAKTSNGALKRFLEPGMVVQKFSFYYGVLSHIRKFQEYFIHILIGSATYFTIFLHFWYQNGVNILDILDML